jgi:hypothetical protein
MPTEVYQDDTMNRLEIPVLTKTKKTYGVIIVKSAEVTCPD